MHTRRSKPPQACEEYTHSPTDDDPVDVDKGAIPPTKLLEDIMRLQKMANAVTKLVPTSIDDIAAKAVGLTNGQIAKKYSICHARC